MPIETSPERTTLAGLTGRTEKFSRKARGLFDGEFFKSLDEMVESGWSRFYNFYVSSKEGQYGNYRNTGALKPDDFRAVLQYAEAKVVELVQGIISGKIDVAPYRLRQESPCSFCSYRSVCRFDWQINDYNLLEPVSKLQVLQKAGGIDG
jgi:ATP-dependent helicase/nuclease subunit B